MTAKINMRRPTGEAENMAARRAQALELRRAGHAYRAIAEKLGVSLRSVYRDVERSLKQLALRELKDAAHLRQLELGRLDALLLAVFDKARGGDLEALDRVLKIIERRCRLTGLDAIPVDAPLAAGGLTIVVNRADPTSKPLDASITLPELIDQPPLDIPALSDSAPTHQEIDDAP